MIIEGFSIWAPEKASYSDWEAWLKGDSELADSAQAPVLSFANPIVYRRFSQLTKMTCLIAHRLKLDTDNFLFTSIRGEIKMQYKINEEFISNGELKPAQFAISVFNTPPAQATILLSSQTPYTAIFSGKEQVIRNLVISADAYLKSGKGSSVLAIYAEEATPDEYRDNLKEHYKPLAIGVRFRASDKADVIPEEALQSPEDFARFLLGSHSTKWVE